MEGFNCREGQLGENTVGLPGKEQVHPGNPPQLRFQKGRHGVGVPGMPQPGAVLEHAHPGRAQEPHFGGELAGLFAAELEFPGHVPVEKHHGFPHGHPVFRPAKTKDVQSALPRDFLRRHPQRFNRVGEPGAVHVEFKTRRLGLRADRPELIDGVNRAHLRGLGHGHRPGLGIVDVVALLHRVGDVVRADLAVFPGQEQELGAVGEILRGAALIGLHVGHLMAEDAVVTLAAGGQRQGVCGGAVEHKKDLAIGLKNLAEEIGGLLGKGVVAVGPGVAEIGFLKRVPSFRTDARVVVACEMAKARRVHGG